MSKIKSFTLTEIILVIIIISVTFILLPKIQIDLKGNGNILLDLKDKVLNYNEDIELICIDKCSKCLVFDSEKKTTKDDEVEDKEKIDEFKFLDDDINVYKIDFTQMQFRDFEDKFETKRVCLNLKVKYHKFKDFIIEYNDKYYLFDAIDKTKVFNSIGELEDYKDNLTKEIVDGF